MKLPINYKNSHWTVRDEAREKYVELQGGKCCHCGNPLDGEPNDEIMAKDVDEHLFPANFFYYPVHLHHSHITGLTIGAVHCRCKAVLWQYHNE
jgi:hypothetical protein